MTKKRHKWPTMDAEYRTQDVVKRLSSGLGVPHNPRWPLAFRYVPGIKGGIKCRPRYEKPETRTPLYGMRGVPRVKGGIAWRCCLPVAKAELI